MKFTPRLKEVIWGGNKLVEAGKKVSKTQNPEKIGESWEISGVDGDVSVVSNGFLKGNNLQELIEVYMGELVGDKVYDKYGLEFPVLIKFIDAQDVLSIQVHPSDELAEVRHSSRGKTEMWYVVDCVEGAALYVGFKKPVSKQEYLSAVAAGNLPDLLARHQVSKGDTYFIPAGTVHAIGKGVVIAEIQETSNITYRIDDWGRVDKNGQPRQLHTQLALDAIDFSSTQNLNVTRVPALNKAEELASCEHFTTNIIRLDGAMEMDYAPLDSFVIYMCVDGKLTVENEESRETLSAMQTLLVPAEATDVTLSGKATVLEIYIK